MGAVSNNWFDCFYSQFSNPHVDRCSNPLPWEPFSSPQSTGARQIQAKYVDRVIPNVGAPCPISSAATEQPPKVTNGVSTNGVTANVVFFDRVTFRVLPLTYFYLPKSDRAYLFPKCQYSLLLQRLHQRRHHFVRDRNTNTEERGRTASMYMYIHIYIYIYTHV